MPPAKQPRWDVRRARSTDAMEAWAQASRPAEVPPPEPPVANISAYERKQLYARLQGKRKFLLVSIFGGDTADFVRVAAGAIYRRDGSRLLYRRHLPPPQARGPTSGPSGPPRSDDDAVA